MKLEQRVQELEQEVALLKGQIQATLLDIQEQMLKRAYPSLQADDGAPVTSGATNDAQSYKTMSARPAPVEQPDDPYAEAQSAVSAPIVKQISANAPYEPEDDFEEPIYAPPMPRALTVSMAASGKVGPPRPERLSSE